MQRIPLAVFFVILFSGCNSVTQHGGTARLDVDQVRLFLPPYANATDDEHAGRALTELTATALQARKVALTRLEGQSDEASLKGQAAMEAARAANATHILMGTVHEYRYKTDLDGDPAVGITLRLVEVRDGRTIWQGSSAKVDVLFASLSTAAHRAVENLVARLPF